MENSLHSLAAQLLQSAYRDLNPEAIIEQIAHFSESDFHYEMTDDDVKKATWINLYNGFFQYLAKAGHNSPSIYKRQLVKVAGNMLSLDEIEHGILRKYRWKPGLGYIAQWFPRPIIKAWAVETMDARIHFALNCGAISCPPIGFYHHYRVALQLEFAMESFLASETQWEDEKKVLRVSKLMQWYQGDFGGKAGVRQMCSKVFKKDFSDFSIAYLPYDWTQKLKYFVGEDKLKSK